MPARARPPAAFFALAALITLGPIYGHFFATGSHEYLGWKMFSRKATDFCAVEYTQVGANGAVTPLDRFVVLQQARSPRSGMWRLRDLAGAHRVAGRMCRALGPVDLRSRVSCATPRGWVLVDPGETNRCGA